MLILKKIQLFVLIFAVLLTFSSCSSSARPDIIMLAERMAETDERYAFDYFDMFIYEDVWHVYLSLCKEDDVMLSFETDGNGNIDNLTVTAFSDSVSTSEEKEELRKLYNTVIDAFAVLTEKETDEKNKSLSYNNTDLYFSDIYETYSSLRYNFIFSSNSKYMCLYCEYYEVMSTRN